ncbi:MAG: response regulator [Candidatus Omnitrophota bacterium]|nr:response regulator [Candidatus Omnitrophota bacterium]
MMAKKIMIVDDDKEFAEEMKELLTQGGYEADIFRDGASAMEAVNKVQPDLILLDLKMTGKNGFQVASELKYNPDAAHIPIIAMTGYYTQQEHAVLIKVCGIKTCLIKPFQPLDVISKIEEILL